MEDARRFGMDALSLAHLREALATPTITVADEYEGVWPQNRPIVQAFLAISLQWRVAARGGGGYAGMGGAVFAPLVPMFIGLDYASVRAGLDAEGIEVTPELWRGLRVMEAEACGVLNESN